MSNPLIQMTEVKKKFGTKQVLDGLNLSINKGDSVVIIGGSGTGKSVTLKCILGILKFDSGEIKINQTPINQITNTQHEKMLKKFGMLFQGSALFDSLKVWQNVAFGLIYGQMMKQSLAKEIAFHKLSQVGLGYEIGELYPSELSGGMQKRVALARAIATEPEIIFFDEPTTGLDPIMADIINDLIVNCVEKLGATALSITHDISSARKISDRIAMLHEGKIIWDGKTNELDTSSNEFVDQFINGKAQGPIKMKTKFS
tara:strand:+ start:460 stop:1233 length:774 start_codon:yes stop_codon:yes gene_type:complete